MRRATKDASPTEYDISVAGLGAPVKIKRHRGARRLTLRVSHVKREVVLTMPEYSSLREAGRFVKEHQDWVRQRLEALPCPVPFADGILVPLRGLPHLVDFVGPSRHRRVAWVEGLRAAQQAMRDATSEGRPRSRLRPLEKFHPKLCVTGQLEHAPRRLRDWLQARAREALSERVDWHAKNLGLKPQRVTLRDQTSRWGSCSSSRVLSFSWRLIMAPPLVLDYVAAHEVAHLKEMNHGVRFWRLVEKTFPRLEEARGWLHEHGHELHRYGARER